MPSKKFDFNSGNQLSSRSVMIWRIIQATVWILGFSILYFLFFRPSLGLMLFWNILIPVAPALLVLATGIWRNICPLATTTLLPGHFGISSQKKLTAYQLGVLNLIGVIALYLIVPLRHAVFNVNGKATGALIVVMAATGVGMGFVFEWKSAWCSSLCPIHPVEQLYGQNVFFSVRNAHCRECVKCVVPCPDSTPNLHPGLSNRTIYRYLSGLLIIGGLPGFIWGWFQVPDDHLFGLVRVYIMPFAGLMLSLLAYIILVKIIRSKYERKLTAFFAAAAVSCYYWYRIPSLLGFGKFAKDGRLVDLSDTIPVWIVYAITITTSSFFFYWLVIRQPNKLRWAIRPNYASKSGKEAAKFVTAARS
jgi:hypothetical protein